MRAMKLGSRSCAVASVWLAGPPTVDVETDSPLLIGTTVADFRGLWGLAPNVRIVSDNNPGQCFDELISSIGALARAVGPRAPVA